MDLLPHDVRAALARFPLGSQDGRGMDALVVVKYFFPAGRYTLWCSLPGHREYDHDLRDVGRNQFLPVLVGAVE